MNLHTPKTAHEEKIAQPPTVDTSPSPQLKHIDGVLYLCTDEMKICCDFTKLLPRISPRALFREPLVSCAKRKGGCAGGLAIDATAGLGEDGLLLAATGYDVLLIEHNEQIVSLLKDGIKRGAEHPLLHDALSRMQVIHADACDILAQLPEDFMRGRAVDVVYLDPMFPERQKNAAVKKKFQLLHLIEAPNADDEALLHAALHAHPQKIIIKRPPKGPHFAQKKPSYSITHKAVRYDVIVP